MTDAPKKVLRLIKGNPLGSTDKAVSTGVQGGSSRTPAGSDGDMENPLPRNSRKPLIQFLIGYCDAIDADIERLMKMD